MFTSELGLMAGGGYIAFYNIKGKNLSLSLVSNGRVLIFLAAWLVVGWAG